MIASANFCRFLSTLSLRRATLEQSASYNAYMISIHALLAESDLTLICDVIAVMTISIHALLAESDCMILTQRFCVSIFLSTLSLRRATNCTSIGRPKRLYFYPRSPCGERQFYAKQTPPHITFLSTLSLRRATDVNNPVFAVTSISIHALLAESDHHGRVNLLRLKHFYPRSPCGERPIVHQ